MLGLVNVGAGQIRPQPVYNATPNRSWSRAMNLELRSERNEDGVVALWLDHSEQKVVAPWAAGLATEHRLLVSLRHADGAQEKLASFFASNA